MYIKNSRPKPDFLHYNHNPKPSHCCFFYQGADYWLQAAPDKIANQQKIEWFFRHLPTFFPVPGAVRGNVRAISSALCVFFVVLKQLLPCFIVQRAVAQIPSCKPPYSYVGFSYEKKEGARLRPPCLCGAFDRPLSGTVKPISPTYGTSTAECLLRRRSYEV